MLLQFASAQNKITPEVEKKSCQKIINQSLENYEINVSGYGCEIIINDTDKNTSQILSVENISIISDGDGQQVVINQMD